MREHARQSVSSRATHMRAPLLAATAVVFLGCGGERAPASGDAPPPNLATPGATEKRALFGDLHVHTRLSLDAALAGTSLSPDDAYRFAKGETIRHPGGHEIRRRGGPLDFAAVTDHGEFMGLVWRLKDPDSDLPRHEIAAELTHDHPEDAFRSLLRFNQSGLADELVTEEILRQAWQEVQAAADRHNQPDEFTTFVAYEFTLDPGGRNLHRNILFRSDAVPDLPFTAENTDKASDLWRWLDDLRTRGIEAMAIPHNSNASDGLMFGMTRDDGDAMDRQFASLRVRNEPLAEISQVKGTSETHPELSPDDEWAGFEITEWYVSTPKKVANLAGGYLRDALKSGLLLEEQIGENPYRLGFIASSDTHIAAPGSVEEFNYHGKFGVVDSRPIDRGAFFGHPELERLTEEGAVSELMQGIMAVPALYGAAGLAGVWAEDNTRAFVYDALRRRETFGTSGPHIALRMVAGYDLAENPSGAVPMGGDLTALENGPPEIHVWARRDPNGTPLQRLQIIKGWLEDGVLQERVIDIACADGLSPDPLNHRCPDNRATVDLATCEFSTDRGDNELQAVWSDPDFVPNVPAFYYARVLENPSCRWSTWDALRSGESPSPALPATIQERAWGSPIWIVP